MDILLRESVNKLGNRGEVVKVAPGYARNFLFPKKLAVPVTEGNKKQLLIEKRNYEKKLLEAQGVAEEAKAKIEALELHIQKRAGENTQLFGSVTSQEVAAILLDKGFEIDRRKLDIPHIKELGEYSATARLSQGISAEFKLVIEPVGE